MKHGDADKPQQSAAEPRPNLNPLKGVFSMTELILSVSIAVTILLGTAISQAFIKMREMRQRIRALETQNAIQFVRLDDENRQKLHALQNELHSLRVAHSHLRSRVALVYDRLDRVTQPRLVAQHYRNTQNQNEPPEPPHNPSAA